MNTTEATHLNVLLSFLFTGDSEDERTAAEQAVRHLADRAHRALGAGVTGEDGAARFAQVFPPGWWELPPGADTPTAARVP